MLQGVLVDHGFAIEEGAWVENWRAVEHDSTGSTLNLERTATDREPSTVSENSFERSYLIEMISDFAAAEPQLQPTKYHDEARTDLSVIPDPGGDLVTVALKGPRRSGPASVDLPTSALWRFAAGMIWRSYLDGPVPLTRWNTASYRRALDEFRAAVTARADAEASDD